MNANRKFKRNTLFISLIVLILSALHVTYVFYHADKDIKDYQSRIAAMNIQTLKERIHSDTSHLSSLASFLERQSPQFWYSAEVALIVEDFCKDSNFTAIGIADTDGILYHFFPEPVDISQRNYFQFALNGSISLESITAEENNTGTNVLNIGLPLFIDGNINGVVVGSYSTDSLDRLLPTGLHETGIRNFIVRNDGAVIINGSDQKLFCNIDDLWLYEKCDISEKDYIKISNSIINHTPGTIKYRINNEMHHIISVPVNFTDTYARVKDVGWNLLVDIPSRVIWDKAFPLLTETVVYTVLLLAILYISFFFYYREKNIHFHQAVRDLSESENAYILQTKRLLKAEMLSRTDAVTGGFNRIALEQEYEKLVRTAQSITVILVDLDNFKQINDRFGHAAGDNIIKQFAELLEHIVQKNDGFSGRIGGDEFVICIPNRSTSASKQLTEQIRQQFAARFSEYCTQCHLGVTMGTAFMPKHGKELQELLNAADQALYDGKKNGKGCVIIAE